MSRTVITEDDLLAEPSSADAIAGTTAEIPAAAVPPASPSGGIAFPAWALAVAAAVAVIFIGGAFLLGQSGRPSQTEVDATVRDAIREVRDGMREDRAAITKRAVDRERTRLESRHRRELAALRKKLGGGSPVQSRGPASSASGTAAAPQAAPPSAPAQSAPRTTGRSSGGSTAGPNGGSGPKIDKGLVPPQPESGKDKAQSGL